MISITLFCRMILTEKSVIFLKIMHLGMLRTNDRLFRFRHAPSMISNFLFDPAILGDRETFRESPQHTGISNGISPNGRLRQPPEAYLREEDGGNHQHSLTF
jgi:hypothetical protein